MALEMKKFFANISKGELTKLWEQIKKEEVVANDTVNAKEFLEFVDSYHKKVIKVPIACFTEEHNLTPEYLGSFFCLILCHAIR